MNLFFNVVPIPSLPQVSGDEDEEWLPSDSEFKEEEFSHESDFKEKDVDQAKKIARLANGGGKCLKCGKVYRYVRDAKRHFRFKHLGKTVDCPACQKSFGKSFNMTRHFHSIHIAK